MATVDITTANAGNKIGLHAAIVTLPTPRQVEILTKSFLIISTVVAVIVAVMYTFATLSSVTLAAIVVTASIVTWVITTSILYANTMTSTIRDGIAIVSLPIMVISVSASTSLFVTLIAEVTLNYNSDNQEVAETAAEIRTESKRIVKRGAEGEAAAAVTTSPL